VKVLVPLVSHDSLVNGRCSIVAMSRTPIIGAFLTHGVSTDVTIETNSFD
jgi:hypothetical protein